MSWYSTFYSPKSLLCAYCICMCVCVWVKERQTVWEQLSLFIQTTECFKSFSKVHFSIWCHYLCVCVSSQTCLCERGCCFSGAFKRRRESRLGLAMGHCWCTLPLLECVCGDAYFTGCSVCYCGHILIFHHPYQSRRCQRMFCQGETQRVDFQRAQCKWTCQSSCGLQYVLWADFGLSTENVRPDLISLSQSFICH